MTKNEFINYAVGLPWVRWGSDWSGCDCYGLVVLYHREVLGVQLEDVPQKELIEGLRDVSHLWERVSGVENACAFMSFVGDIPTHVGLCIGGDMVLHAHGDGRLGGSVRISSLKTMQKLFGEIKFYRLKQC